MTTATLVLAWALLVGPVAGAAWAGVQYRRELLALSSSSEPDVARQDPTPGVWEPCTWSAEP